MAVDTTAADLAGSTIKRTITPASRQQRQLAAVSSGLYVRAPAGRRERHYRSGRLLSRLLTAFADRGRPLTGLQVPLARAWSELEILSSDCYAKLQAAGSNADGKLLAAYLSLRRGQLSYSLALGMSPTSEAGLAREMARFGKDLEGLQAQRTLNEKYGAITGHE